jgi:5-methylcytosine-specific restriction protein A
MTNRRKRRYISVCAEHGCPELTDERFCERHTKDYFREHESRRPSASSKGYDAQWRKTRQEFLRAYPVCQDERGCVAKATDVDHIDGEGPRGPRGHDWTNLRALCHSHHSKRTARDQPGGFSMGARADGPFVVLIGESGVGKTTVGDRVAAKLNGMRMARDDFDYGWRDLYPVLDHTEHAVVECVRIPGALVRRIRERSALLVELRLDNEVRRQRLEAREVDPDDADMLFRIRPGKNAYEQHLDPDLVLETSGDPEDVAAEICKRAQRLTVGTL